jgi:hypothetical protein
LPVTATPSLGGIGSDSIAARDVPVGAVRYGITPVVSTSFNGNIARVGVNYHF